jgi:DNA replication protein DnaC
MYLTQAQNVLITGPTGTGKSFMATALGRAACELGKRVRYANTARLTTELKQAKTEGSLIKELKKLEKTDLLILDDFGLQVLDATGRSLLMDVMEDRHGRKSTMVVGQIPITSWHEVIGDLTLADALMDRWVHGSYQIELDSESMRKKMSQAENTKAN